MLFERREVVSQLITVTPPQLASFVSKHWNRVNSEISNENIGIVVWMKPKILLWLVDFQLKPLLIEMGSPSSKKVLTKVGGV